MIKDLLLIDSGLLFNFQVKAIDIVNYFCNRLLTRYNGPAFISKKAWTSTRQNLKYPQIFKKSINTLISNKKHRKLDVGKT